MKLSEELKKILLDNFKHVVMPRTAEDIKKTLEVNVKKSDNMRMFPTIGEVAIKRIDETHDTLLIEWEDYSLECVVTWKKSEIGNCYVLMNIE